MEDGVPNEESSLHPLTWSEGTLRKWLDEFVIDAPPGLDRRGLALFVDMEIDSKYREAEIEFPLAPRFSASLPRHHDFFPLPKRLPEPKNKNKISKNAHESRNGPIEGNFRSSLPFSETIRSTFDGEPISGRHPLLSIASSAVKISTCYELGSTLTFFQDPAQSTCMFVHVLDVVYLPPSAPYRGEVEGDCFSIGQRVVFRNGSVGDRGGQIAEVTDVFFETITVKLEEGGDEIEVAHTDVYHLADNDDNKKKPLKDGDPVVLSGLISAKHLNGSFGYIKDYVPNGDGRLRVAIGKESEILAKPTNLVAVKKPLIALVVAYMFRTREEVSKNPIEFTTEASAIVKRCEGSSQCQCLPRDVIFLRKRLDISSTFIDSDSQKKYLRDAKLSESTWSISLLVPTKVPELDTTVLLKRKLKLQSTCRACGAAGVPLKKCGGCSAVVYCSSDCQMSDWARHKPECKKSSAPSSSTSESNPHLVRIPVNAIVPGRNATSQVFGPSAGKIRDNTKIPGNVHGDKEFIVKVQHSISKEAMNNPRGYQLNPSTFAGDIMIYDQPQQIQTNFNRKMFPNEFQKIMEAMVAHGITSPMWGNAAKKVYVKARRIGLEIELNLDPNNLPPQKQTW